MPGVACGEPVVVERIGAPLLEGPVWVARDAALWFTCIKTPMILRHDPATCETRRWTAPDQVGFCLPASDRTFIAGLKSGLARFDPADGSFRHIVDPEPDLPNNRLNDAIVDPHGRLWFGTMDDAEQRATGRIYRYDGDGRCHAVTTPVTITNGPAFSPDGMILYHVDTLGGIIYRAEVTADCELADQQILARIAPEDGYPDGPTVDAEGCLWIGLYNGWGARRYSPAGELLETVRFPVSAVTKLAFGGERMRSVFATTAAKHLDAEGRERELMAGDLFTFEAHVPGLRGAEIRFT